MTNHKNEILDNYEIFYFLINKGIKSDDLLKLNLIDYFERYCIENYFYDNDKDEFYYQILNLIDELKALINQ